MWIWVLRVVVSLLALLGLVLIVLTARRMALQRPVGTFACSLRVGEHPDGDGWSYGIGRYHGDRVEWFAVFGLSMRPRRTLRGRELLVGARRAPVPAENGAIPAGVMVVECRYGGERVDLAMTPDVLTGFLSWVEAAPPSGPML